jgi:hypothetical protein
MIRQNLVGLTAMTAFTLAMIAEARCAILEFDCSDKYGVYYNIWADTDRSTVSVHYARPDLPQELRVYPAEITQTQIRWAAQSAQTSLNASIDLATGRYYQVYGGVARGSNTFQCARGSTPLPR